MSTVRLGTPVVLVMLLWPGAASGQDVRALGPDRSRSLTYADEDAATAVQGATIRQLVDLLREFGSQKAPQVVVVPQPTGSTTPVTFRFRVGMFIEDVTADMVTLFADYRKSQSCTTVTALENAQSSVAGGGSGGVFGNKIAAARKRC